MRVPISVQLCALRHHYAHHCPFFCYNLTHCPSHYLLPPSRTVDRGGYTYVGKEGSKDEGGAGLIAGADAAAGHAKQSRGN